VAQEAGEGGRDAPAEEAPTASAAKFAGVRQPGDYAVVSKKLGLAAWNGKGNRNKSVPGFTSVYWHTRVAKKGSADLYLSPGVTILFDCDGADGSAIYLCAATVAGLPTALLVCGEDRANVRRVPVSFCVGVVLPTGPFDDKWVLGKVEAFGAEQERLAKVRKGGSWLLILVVCAVKSAKQRKKLIPTTWHQVRPR
jgi:hypothetical protein